MAIETSFTIKQVSVEEALRQAETKVEASAKRMDSSLAKGGGGASDAVKQVTQGLEGVNKLGGKAGGTLKGMVEGFTAMLNPVALVTAAVGLLVAGLQKMYDSYREKMEQIRKTAEWTLAQAQEAGKGVETRQDRDAGYLRRLEEINDKEVVDNATKLEAVRIINLLTTQYGDLGLSIDEATGKIMGLTEAQKRQSALMREERWASLEAEYSASEVDIGETRRGILGRGVKIGKLAAYADEEKRELQLATRMSAGGRTDEIMRSREARAYENYLKAGGDEQNVPEEYRRITDSDEVRKLKEAQERLRQQMSSATGSDRQAFQREVDIIDRQIAAQRKVEVASELAGDANLDAQAQEKWQKMLAKAKAQLAIVLKMRNMATLGHSDDSLASGDLGKDVAKGQESLTKAERDAQQAEAKLAEKRRALSLVGETQEEAYDRLNGERDEAQRKVESETTEAEKLREEYQRLAQEAAEAQSKMVNGVFADPADEEAFLQAEKSRLDMAVKLQEAEKKISEAKGNQLDIEKEIKAMELSGARAREQEEEKARMDREAKRAEYVRGYLGSLFKGIFGDTQIHTDSLRQRGGYTGRSNVEAMNINRQILDGILASNRFLAQINNSIYGVGRI